jgi:hypothetical protein
MRRVAVLAVALVLGPFTAAATSQEYPPNPKPISVDRSVVAPGDTIKISGSKAPSSAEVTIQFFPGPIDIGTAVAGTDGRWETDVTIPADATAGEHILSAVTNGQVLATIPVTVGRSGVSAAETDGGGRSSVVIAVLVLLAVVGISIAGLFVARRRRQATGMRL